MAIIRREVLQQGMSALAFASLAGACTRKPATGPAATQTDIGKFDAVETALRIRNGDITALEAIDSAIARAEAINPKINAIVTKTFEHAREQAAAHTTSVPEGALSGVPTFIKDLVDVAGVPTEAGSRAYGKTVARSQFAFVDDLHTNGLISLGKSTTPEFGLTATTEPLSSGITRNPWNLDHSSGGSSGGGAALVAAGVVPIAHASDGGGSIRIPASCCGLVGLKPSRDRFHPPRDESLTPVRISTQGVVSRTVRDTAAFLAAMEIPAGPAGRLAPTGLVTGPAQRRLKIGILKEPPHDVPVHPDVTHAIDQTTTLCQQLGHQLVPMHENIDPVFSDHFLLYWASIANAIVSDWETTSATTASEAQFEPFTLGLREHFLTNTHKINDTILWLIGFAATWRRLFDDLDVIMSPVLTTPAVKIGHIGPDVPYQIAIERLTRYAQFTAPANVAGAPSLSLPLAMSGDQLPIGVMFSGQTGDERTLLELAFELEEAAPWHHRTPPIFAGGA